MFTAPPSLRRIDSGAFGCCRRLSFVKLNEGLEVLGSVEEKGLGVFRDCFVEDVALPSTLRVLGRWWLRHMALPKGLRKIGGYCFSGT